MTDHVCIHEAEIATLEERTIHFNNTVAERFGCVRQIKQLGMKRWTCLTLLGTRLCAWLL